ncbi:cutinase family protein [Modestobacter marinus]|uniref:cutinase family protein n=1 Tax=Modestobacter marinus TaxID=477641 RepID=UPI001C956F16|nr:cutinase family protein [Modestobacter marinus]
MAVKHRSLLIISITAVLVSLLVPTAINAAVEKTIACGYFEPAANQLVVKISNVVPMRNARVTTGTAKNTAGQTSSGVRSLVTDPTTGDFTMEVTIPHSTINAGTYTVQAIFSGDPNSEDQFSSGRFEPCTGQPGATGNACADVLFIGIRGSGQEATEAGGYGDMINAVRAGMVAYMPGDKRLQTVALDYTAASVLSFFVPPSGMSNYFGSIDHGVKELHKRLAEAQRDCGDQKIVLAGYSQGALVANMVARNARNVVGVLLVADPGRVPKQTGKNLGSARSGYGVYQATGIDLGSITTRRNAMVVELCNRGDVICDWSHRGTPDVAATVGVATHLAYSQTASGQLIEMGRQGVIAAGFTPRR